MSNVYLADRVCATLGHLDGVNLWSVVLRWCNSHKIYNEFHINWYDSHVMPSLVVLEVVLSPVCVFRQSIQSTQEAHDTERTYCGK